MHSQRVDLFISYEGNIAGKSTEELNTLSFLLINNCFRNISSGGCKRNIHGVTATEIRHIVLLGLCKYIAEGMETIFVQCALDLIYHIIVRIYECSRKQSECDLLYIRPFFNRLMSVK